ncbi:hypothetical protein [Hydrogenobacter thermophilus]|uniref:hypothetical protein n=1 Tax=Hydrogenobacter thermophilus TaxID=940 RepID=UPI0030F895CB
MNIELSNRTVYIQELKFKHFKKLFSVISDIVQDVAKGEIRVEKYLDKGSDIISQLTGLAQEEIDELSAGDALKLLNACIEVIVQDTAFLQELKNTIQTVRNSLTSLTSQKSLSQKDTT